MIHPRIGELRYVIGEQDVCHITDKHERRKTESERETQRAPPKGRTYSTSPLLHMFSSFTVTSDLCPTPFKHAHTHTGIPFPCVKLTTHFCTD